MLKLKMIDQENQIVFSGKVTRLKLPEKLVIEKSIDWFNDPEPCFIHRSAVMKRLFIELEDEILEKSDKEQSIETSFLKSEILKSLSNYNNVIKINYKK